MEDNDILIVIPTYNERENVSALIAQLLQVVPEADVIIVDDNSPDGTANQVQQMFGANSRVSANRIAELRRQPFGRLSNRGGARVSANGPARRRFFPRPKDDSCDD